MLRLRMVERHPLLIVEHNISVRDDDEGEEEGEANMGRRYLIAADLHIGFEHELIAKGIRIDGDSYVQEMLDELLSIARDEQCNSMILLGDIKESTKGISVEEWKSVPLFIAELVRNLDELYIVPGNHDSYIKRLLPDSVRIMNSKGMLIDDTLFIHGHTAPRMSGMSVRRIVMGHIHPIFTERESVLSGERVWIVLKIRSKDHEKKSIEIVIMPAFNRYITPTARYNENRGKDIQQLLRRMLGKDISIVKATILTLDGSVVGDENVLLI